LFNSGLEICWLFSDIHQLKKKDEEYLAFLEMAFLLAVPIVGAVGAVVSGAYFYYRSAVKFLTAEKETWREHDVKFDRNFRELMLGELDKFVIGEQIIIGYVEREFQGVPFQHWFVTNGVWKFEFGGPNLSIYEARVQVTGDVPKSFIAHATEHMTAIMKQRMSHILGMKNYSLCFRNCEHVANYVFRGRWVSMQMLSPNGDGTLTGTISRHFRDHIIAEHQKYVNSFPTTLRATFAREISGEKVYPFLNGAATFSSVEYFLDHAEDTKNFLVLGPMGSGKSRIINAFFNANVCDEGTSLDAVTKEITFIKGSLVYVAGENRRTTRSIVLIDTIGLCDTVWTENEVHQLIKSRISSNSPKIHGVLVLQPANERLNPHAQRSMQQLLNWLQFPKHKQLFHFLLTKSDMTPNLDKDLLTSQLQGKFNITDVKRTKIQKDVVNELPIYFTEFPQVVDEESQEKFKEVYKSAIWDLLYLNSGPLVVSSRQRSCYVM